ncbi:MAG: HNH endonuclease signature motif containing protein [Nitrosarchaeum sp.]|nr:HNH endonuclease signature motif containing protein [Nitrosarchaeum sp.]
MSVVVLNKNFQYWTEVDIKKVFKWLLNDKIEIVVSDTSEEVGGITFKIPKPLVVRLLEFVGYKVKKSEIGWSKEAVFIRDENICQYWHHDDRGRQFKYKCSNSERTLDHIKPLSKGGVNSFENCVCSCRWHNITIKRNRLPEEAGMKLIRQPVIPRRIKGDYVYITFKYNPQQPAHKAYVENILGVSAV